MRLSDGGFFFFWSPLQSTQQAPEARSALMSVVSEACVGSTFTHSGSWEVEALSPAENAAPGEWRTFLKKLLELNRVCLTQFRLFFFFFFNNFCLEYEAKDCCLCVRVNSCNLQLLRCGVSHYSGRPLQSILRISLHSLTVKRSKFPVNTFSCATMKTHQSD